MRADVHSELCLYAFHHESTRKQLGDFKDPYQALNWRGLYRGRQPIGAYGGFIALSSGRGRAGYAIAGLQSREFVHPLPRGCELPGTTLVVRLPLPLEPVRLPRSVGPALSAKASRSSALDPPILKWGDIEGGNIGQAISEVLRLKGETETHEVAIVFPFCRLTSENELVARPSNVIPLPRLLKVLSGLPPDIVPILFYVELPEEELLVLAQCRDEWTLATGHPRILAVWNPHYKRLVWRILGVFPPDAKEMLFTLEETGTFSLPPEAPVSSIAVAQGLAGNYPHLMAFNSERRTLRLTEFAGRLSLQSQRRAFDTAFEIHWARSDVRRRVVTDEARPVRVHTGILVRRYLCVLYLVESSPMLPSLLGRRLVDAVEELSAKRVKSSLVIDDYGSGFVAQRLLCDIENAVTILNRQEAYRLSAGSEVILFVDAIFKGRTVSELITALNVRGVRVRGVTACLDLRETHDDEIAGVHVRTLAKVTDFAAEEMPQAVIENEIQVDGVTHVPINAEASAFVEIAPRKKAERLLTPGVIQHGLHRLGGRLHTISLPVAGLLKSCRNELIDCLTDELSAFLKEYLGHATDLVFFYRADSEIGNQIPVFFDHLVARGFVGVDRGFQRAIPTAQRGAKTIFTHLAVDILAECRPIEQQLSMFGERQPSEHLVAVYLDDAAVT
ncbi:MAG: hypothetical protein ACREAC_09820, partial [Blastocatellia bacterium]